MLFGFDSPVWTDDSVYPMHAAGASNYAAFNIVPSGTCVHLIECEDKCMAGAEFIKIFKISECHVTYCVTEPSSDLKLEGTLQHVGDHDAYSNVVTTYVAPQVLTLFVDLLYFQVNITFYDPFIELQATDVCLQSLALLQPGNVDLSVAGSMILRYRPADNECHEAAVVFALLLLMSLLWTYCMEYYDTVTALNATERVEKEDITPNFFWTVTLLSPPIVTISLSNVR